LKYAKYGIACSNPAARTIFSVSQYLAGSRSALKRKKGAPCGTP